MWDHASHRSFFTLWYPNPDPQSDSPLVCGFLKHLRKRPIFTQRRGRWRRQNLSANSHVSNGKCFLVTYNLIIKVCCCISFVMCKYPCAYSWILMYLHVCIYVHTPYYSMSRSPNCKPQPPRWQTTLPASAASPTTRLVVAPPGHGA